MHFQLLLFDLDNTLIRTDDLVGDFRGVGNTGPRPPAYVDSLRQRAQADPLRVVYSAQYLAELRAKYPNLKFGVFTRSPRVYTSTLLSLFYPNFQWDAVVTFEDVQHTKPDPEGIYVAAKQVGVTDPGNVVLVGDGKVDILAAYRAGIWAVADRSTWPFHNIFDNYQVKERLPDVLIDEPAELIDFLENPTNGWPLLEQWSYWKTDLPPHALKRIEQINHFDRSGDSKSWVKIAVLGRRFRNDDLLEERRKWHPVSHEIENLKDATVFPAYWISALRSYILSHWQMRLGVAFIVSVIPAKPGRTPRLEHLLMQLAQSHQAAPICEQAQLEFVPDIMEYTANVRSNHGEHLSAQDRFINIRDHLVLKDAAGAAGRRFIIIDDVVTTGATLYYAHKFLTDAGAADVFPISLTKAVSAQ